MGLGAIFFDVGGVLIEADVERYAERAARLFKAPVDDVRREVGLRVRELEKGSLTSQTFWALVGEGLGKPVKPARTHKLWSNLMKDGLHINDGLYSLSRVLARQGLILGILSNVIEDHAQVLEDRGVYMPFSPCLLSCRSGQRKPDVAFYRQAIKRAGVAPGTCLLVDDVEANLGPARSAGMRTHHYKDLGGLMMALRRHGIKTQPDTDDPWLVDERDFPWEADWDAQLRFCVNYAVLAHSSHNRQPWRFRVAMGSLEVEADTARALAVADPRNRELIMSCGAAWHHLRVALAHFGFTWREQPTPDGMRRLTLTDGPKKGEEQRALSAIPYQRAEWVAFEDLLIEPARLQRVRKALKPHSGVKIHWFEEAPCKARLAGLILQAARGQWRDRRFRTEMADWCRRGMAPASLGLGRMGYPIFWRLLPHYDIGSNLAQREAEKTRQAPALAVISTKEDDPERWFEAGTVLADLILCARLEGLAALPVHNPLESDPFREGMLDLTHGAQPQVVLRLGYGHNVSPAPRRGPKEVIVQT